jgi:neutral amino acid transport system substrate-binding protein
MSICTRIEIPLLCALVLRGMLACQALEPFEDCASDQDCQALERCHPEGRFCELDRSPMVIGAMLPITGNLKSVGQELSGTLEFYEDLLARSGGVLGRRLVVDLLDDEGSDDVALARMQQFAARRVVGVVGPLRSAQALGTQAVAHARRVVNVSPAAGASELAHAEPEVDRYFFQTTTSIRRGSASALALFAANQGPVDKGPCTRMAVLHTNDITGIDYRDSLIDLFAKQGGCVIDSISFPPLAKSDYLAEVEFLLDTKPQCAVLVASPGVGANLIQEFNERLAKLSPELAQSWQSFYWLGTSSLHFPGFLEAGVQGQLRPSEGVYGADIDPAPTRIAYTKLRDAYNAFHGLSPDRALPPFAANTFDALAVLTLAVQRGGRPRDGTATRDALWEVANEHAGDHAIESIDVDDGLRALIRGESIDYAGASGRIELDARGVVGNGTVIWRVVNGAFEDVVKYSEAQTEQAELGSKSCAGSG